MKKLLLATLLIISILVMAKVDVRVIHQSTIPSLSTTQTQ